MEWKEWREDKTIPLREGTRFQDRGRRVLRSFWYGGVCRGKDVSKEGESDPVQTIRDRDFLKILRFRERPTVGKSKEGKSQNEKISCRTPVRQTKK